MARVPMLAALLKDELIQRRQEGCDVEGFSARIEAAGEDDRELMDVYEALTALPIQEGFEFREPNDLEAIRAERPDGPRLLPRSMTEAQWRDKFLGAWLGRCAGCALGKPLERGPFMGGGGGRPGWENVRLWFEGADAWPIRGYTPSDSDARVRYGLEVNPDSKSLREVIRFMESDDDIRYTVLGLLLLERKGSSFGSRDVGELWLEMLPLGQVYTAETQAYVNFASIWYRESREPAYWEEKREWVRTHLNPYREWIGAQIRADGFAYGAAGHPELAAEFAWRDASFSHVKNGIYGEMFAAAMIAAAFVESDMERVVEIGLSEIPRDSRLARDVLQAVDIARSSATQLELVERVWAAFEHYHPVHTNNNAALVAASLVFAKGDYETAIATAVLGGWDTDCNGATVGSIMGASLGAGRLPSAWIEPLNDTLYSEVKDFHPIAISACADRSFSVFRALNPSAAIL
ncbi:ADP-ribosylglycohydrolase family protein [Paenibacillus antri]|uniref:ADP-ribosylglycohydrolase family protein n=1 Tax=Paenibacillus antri TaxID=2582848 RepID=A0A5R9GD07_9BACL|nr:ADP-ribosylglycohydrolase family protein [Paenibacillus antri]TLS51054.1 ADP-ribosylglycohydrolase family protein [Paenibacillus antri]